MAAWRTTLAALFAAILAVPGCSRGSLPRSGVEAAALEAAGAGWTAPRTTGSLGITIRWPDRPFGVATIPFSTRTLVMRFRQGDTLIDTRVVPRPGDAATSSVVVPLPAGDGFNVEALAYREDDPVPDGATPVAGGSATGLRVLSSRRTTTQIDLVPAYPPAIEAFSPTFGLAGQTVTISGSNLTVPWQATPSITFSGVAATVTAAGPTSVTVEVPDSTTGPIAIGLDGLTGTASGSFRYVSLLRAVTPQVAREGDWVYLEGLFGPDTTASFGGGKTAPVEVLGRSRARVKVPAGARPGDLSVTHKGYTTPGLAFTPVAYELALDAFVTYVDQGRTLQTLPGLRTARQGHAALMIGDYLCVFGGKAPYRSIERAFLDADGTLAPFEDVSTSLKAGRWNHAAVRIGEYVYMLGGRWQDTYPGIERAPILQDGDIGAFEVVDPSVAVEGPVAQVIGNGLYMIGGFDSMRETSQGILRAPIDERDRLGAFAPVASSLVVGRKRAASAVAGEYLYVFGGYDPAGNALDSIERARIQPDGSLGAFELAGTGMSVARGALGAARFGDSVALTGGCESGSKSLVEVVRFESGTGTLAGVSTGPGLRGAHCGAPALVIGNFLHVLGGQADTRGNSPLIEIAPIDRVAGVSTAEYLAAGGLKMSQVRAWPAALAAGRDLFVLGGMADGTPIRGAERVTLRRDGSADGTFTDAAVELGAPRSAFTLLASGRSAFAIGGLTTSWTPLRSVEHARLSGSGFASSFEPYPLSALVQGRYWHCAVVTASSNLATRILFLIGGKSAAGTLKSVERAEIGADDTLFPFATDTAELANPRHDHACTVVGNYVYAVGGYGGSGPLATVERAPIDTSGSLGAFQSVPGVNLVAPRYSFSLVRLGQALYAVGGYTDTVESAAINADGSLGTFEVVPGLSSVPAGTLDTTRPALAHLQIGDGLYLLGGRRMGTLDRAGLR